MSVIAVLGAGTVGQTLATGWARAGHEVVLGSRTPATDRVHAAIAATGARRAATHADAARDADLVVVTVPGDQVDALVDALGTALRDRPLIDTTNVRTPHAPVLHHLDALVGAGAVAFRALHSTGWEQMAQPTFDAQRSDMAYAGPDGPARTIVETAIADPASGRSGWARAPTPSRSPTHSPASGSTWSSPAAGTADSACGCSPTTKPR
jgi:predicted dinucleotide-binding enzyme